MEMLKLFVLCGLLFVACKAEQQSEKKETEVVLSSPCELLKAVEDNGMEKAAAQSLDSPIVYQGETKQIEKCALALLEKIESQANGNQSTYHYQVLESMCINADGIVSEAIGATAFMLFENGSQDLLQYSSNNAPCLLTSLGLEMEITLSGTEEGDKETLKGSWLEKLKTIEPNDNLKSLIEKVESL